MTGVALAICASVNPAQANDRISLYEVNTFLTKMTNAVNSRDLNVSNAFLNSHVKANAIISDTRNASWVDGRYVYSAWNGYHASPYYRYPAMAYNSYLKPTSYQSVGKTGLIASLNHKKTMIPRYHQTMSVLATRMPADASSVVVDVNLREFGLAYTQASYGLHGYAQKVEHSNARCQLGLKKEAGFMKLTSMSCNTVINTPVL